MSRALLYALIAAGGVAIGVAAVTAWWTYKPKVVTR